MERSTGKLDLIREGRMASVLLKLGLPTIVGMLINSLYSIVDAYFVGGLGTPQMGAVSVAFPITQTIVGLGMTFGSGAASYISRLLGKQRDCEANRTASVALWTSLATGLFAIALALYFLNPLLRSLGATPTIFPYARAYAVIYIMGSIFNIFNVTMNNIVASEGATKLTMFALSTGAVLNAVLDPLFIYTLEWGIEGAAIASVVAQLLTSLIYLGYILLKKGHLRMSIQYIKPSREIYWEILKIGIPTFVFQLLTSICLGLTNTAASRYGDSAVAAMGIVMRIMTLGTYVVFGYMKGFQPVAGYSYGARQYGRLREAIRISLIGVTLFGCVLSLFLIVFAPSIVAAFSQGDPLVVSIGTVALRANAAVFPVIGYVFIYMALFLALGMGREGGLLSISRQGLCFVPVIFILPLFCGLYGVVFAQPVADILTLILTVWCSLPFKKQMKQWIQQPDARVSDMQEAKQ